MTVRKLDENGDIVTSGVQFIRERDEIAQTVKTRLQLFLGEYFRDTTDGTPWFESILGKGSALSNKEAVLRNRIVRTPGVIRLISFSTDYDLTTRRYSVSAGILTQYGTTDVYIGSSTSRTIPLIADGSWIADGTENADGWRVVQ